MQPKPVFLIDWDDVICPLNSIALELHNQQSAEQYNLEHLESWSAAKHILWDVYQKTELYSKQVPMDSAVDMIQELQSLGTVIIPTTPFPQFYELRKQQINLYFPNIQDEHIFIGTNKNTLNADFLLDDNLNTCITSKAKHPVLLAKPWNKSFEEIQQSYPHVKRVNTHKEFLNLVHQYIPTIT